MGEAFLSFPSLQGAAAQEAEGNSHPDKRTADISCGAAPPTAPSPGPGITRHRAPWVGEATSPTWAGAQNSLRRQQATDPTCRGGSPVTPQAPGAHPPGVN